MLKRSASETAKGTGRPVRTPTILQMEAVECGAAALAIVLAHFGRFIPLEELRLACGVSRDGSKASNVVRAARRYGLEAKGYKKEPQELQGMPVPMILHWNFNHFLVFEGFKKDRAYINDPGSGPRSISREELDQSFTGVVLTFAPGPDFAKSGAPPRLLPALGRRLTGTGWALAFVILAGLALVIPGMVAPIFSKVFVDNVLLENHREWLGPLLLAMTATALLTGALTWLEQAYLLRLETRIALTSSSRFFWHVLRLPVEFYNQRFAGDISTRVAINDRVAQLLSRDLATSSLSTLMIVFFAALLFQYDAVLTLIGIAVVAGNVVVLRYVSRKRTDDSRRLLQERGKLYGTAIGGLQTIETLKAMGGESSLFARWSGYQTKVVNIRQELERYTQILDAVPPLLLALNSAIILGLGSLRVMNGAMSLGGLVAFQLLMISFLNPVSRLVSVAGKLQTAQGDMNRLDDVLGYAVDPALGIEMEGDELPSLELPVKLSGRLELRDVTFGYSALSPPLLDGFNLTLTPGARVALVGGSGSGKSTVAKLVAGLYTPWKGEILFDGLRRTEIPRSILSNSVATVDQSLFLFEGAVRDNLTLWDATIGLPEVVTAARDAAIHEDIAARSGGYDSPVDEDGANWSGGQRQRLEIARALVGRPTLLVLDEATSALDPETEKQIDESLRRRGCTCLIVAHRLSTIRDADEILVLDGGKVVERGTHQQLIGAGGVYARLLQNE